MSSLRLLFGVAVFLAAFLLFLVEPMAAKQILPLLGGSAAVWVTCLVFFQTALLAGYLYAHWSSQRRSVADYFVLLCLALASACAWALRPAALDVGGDHPVRTVFGALSLWIGAPFLLLSATSPLIQAWWTRVEMGKFPYRLYALSNVASLLALALYPSLIEPYLTLKTQRISWAVGFLAFAVIACGLARRVSTLSPALTSTSSTDPREFDSASLSQKLLWVGLPMAAAMQLSAITSHLTANIAAIPLLWIVPLAVYLLTLILAFQFPSLLPRGILVRLLVLVLASIAYMLSKTDFSWPIWLTIPMFLLALFVTCLFCHCEACWLRPQRNSEATLFYLLFAAGGALGSFLIGIAAPLLFRFNYDLPITFFVTALLALTTTWRTHWSQRMLWTVASIAMLAVVFMVRTAHQRDTTVAVRNFYGSLRVKQDHSFPGATVRTLLNGSIQHGTQIFASDDLRRTPTTYYAQDSGVGYALRLCCPARARSVGVVGLGAGTVAAYGKPGDRFRFYEINPADVPVARNVFTYIRDSGAAVDIVEGDARTSLAAEPPQHFDVLVIDAFSGDAIPLHLLTTQALALYRRHLAPGGILAFHISNQHVDLGPPIALLAQSAGLQARRVSSLSNDARGEFGSTWMLLTDSPSVFTQPDLAAHAAIPEIKPGLRVWTDDYSALLPVLRW